MSEDEIGSVRFDEIGPSDDHVRRRRVSLDRTATDPPQTSGVDLVVEIDLRPTSAALIKCCTAGGSVWSLPLSAIELKQSGRDTTHLGATFTAGVYMRDYPSGPRGVTYRIVDGEFVESQPTLDLRANALGAPEALDITLDIRFMSATLLFAGYEAPDDYAHTTSVHGHFLLLGCLVGLLAPPVVGGKWSEVRKTTTNALQALALRGDLDGETQRGGPGPI